MYIINIIKCLRNISTKSLPKHVLLCTVLDRRLVFCFVKVKWTDLLFSDVCFELGVNQINN